MTRTVLVAGTASHVGKSTVTTGLCRLLSRRGRAVAPFKAQNMTNNARVAITPDGGWGEIGGSQHVQARAAGVTPTTDLNPVLLKPQDDRGSQLIVHGEVVGHFDARTYYDEEWQTARDGALVAFQRLADTHDVIVAEGAGSIAEINLHDRDLANVETARFADADILLVTDIERGGAFASVCGTVDLLPEDLRSQAVGVIINKFRGDESLLEPGIETIERRTGVPVLGVLPHEELGLPAEDSLSLGEADSSTVFGRADGVPEEASVTIGVPRLPQLANFTDVDPLADMPGVRVAYLPRPASLLDADAIVVLGSKDVTDSCRALRDAGWIDALRSFEGPIVGVGGGYQLLGERIHSVAGSGRTSDTIEGIGLLPVETRLHEDKDVRRVTRAIDGAGPLSGVTAEVGGFEIKDGRTTQLEAMVHPVGPESAARDHVMGTYLHGLFEDTEVRRAFVDSVFAHAGLSRPDAPSEHQSPYDAAADLVRSHLDLSPLPVA